MPDHVVLGEMEECKECGLKFDLMELTDALEFFFGHDCQVKKEQE